MHHWGLEKILLLGLWVPQAHNFAYFAEVHETAFKHLFYCFSGHLRSEQLFPWHLEHSIWSTSSEMLASSCHENRDRLWPLEYFITWFQSSTFAAQFQDRSVGSGSQILLCSTMVVCPAISSVHLNTSQSDLPSRDIPWGCMQRDHVYFTFY